MYSPCRTYDSIEDRRSAARSRKTANRRIEPTRAIFRRCDAAFRFRLLVFVFIVFLRRGRLMRSVVRMVVEASPREVIVRFHGVVARQPACADAIRPSFAPHRAEVVEYTAQQIAGRNGVPRWRLR